MSDIKNTFNSQLLGMTTIIECTIGTIKFQGSGFFYCDLAPADHEKQGPQWRQIKETWLITNRHVVFPKINDVEVIPDNFTFNFRKTENGNVEWVPVTLTKDELKKRTRIHPNVQVDVVVIAVGDLMVDLITKKGEKNLLPIGTVTSDNLPEKSLIEIDVTSDVIIASYPRGFYDEVNKFPIVKSGIIASSWGANFNGLPRFLVDAQLFPGSSGGLVLSKPQNIAFIDGKIMYNSSKQFVLLGLYSGEPFYQEQYQVHDMTIIQKKSYGLGNVWYSSLIPEIIKLDVKIAP